MKDFIVLYSTTPSPPRLPSAKHHIIRCLNPPGPNGTDWQTIYQGMFAGRKCPSALPIGPFSDIAELDRYCFKIIQHHNLPGIGLLECERYNRILEGIHSFGELKDVLFKKCDYIENPDYKKAGFLKRLLN